MGKLSKLIFLMFVAFSLFLTGCNDGDDFNKWQAQENTNTLLFTMGVPRTFKDVRAAVSPEKVITVAGVLLKFVESKNDMDYYSNYLSRTVINEINKIHWAEFKIDSKTFYISESFFNDALNSVPSGYQPNIELTFYSDLRVESAKMNGKNVSKPEIKEELPIPVPTGLAKLTIDGDVVTATISNTVGQVKEYRDWTIKFVGKTVGSEEIIVSKGQHSSCYSIRYSGNTITVTISSTGKANLKKGETYSGKLVNAVVYTDLSETKPVSITSEDTIFYVNE